MRSILKKYRNLLRFIVKFLIIYYLNKILSVYRYYILPSLSVGDLAKIKYSDGTSSFYFDNNKKKINTLKIEGSEFISDLCKLGKAFNTDKSSFNSKTHRHGYTYFYDVLFSGLRSKNFNFAEIGIYKNNSFIKNLLPKKCLENISQKLNYMDLILNKNTLMKQKNIS